MVDMYAQKVLIFSVLQLFSEAELAFHIYRQMRRVHFLSVKRKLNICVLAYGMTI